jgi:hypothetical protein
LDGPYAMAFQTASMFVCLSRVCLSLGKACVPKKVLSCHFFSRQCTAKQSKAEQGRAAKMQLSSRNAAAAKATPPTLLHIFPVDSLDHRAHSARRSHRAHRSHRSHRAHPAHRAQ